MREERRQRSVGKEGREGGREERSEARGQERRWEEHCGPAPLWPPSV